MVVRGRVPVKASPYPMDQTQGAGETMTGVLMAGAGMGHVSGRLSAIRPHFQAAQ